ncbi:tripartite tricarboxylate transporter TctB family protein [Roseateles sp. So40a]|uniref:tripartite tricarboxylate transporter TctB family protein n=1 Tax=Roseateles sp. So40a TaxID=3400226 RepID=UPI003A85A21C
MKIKSQRDFWSGLMFVVVGVAFACGSIINYSFGTSARPGPGYFPFGLGVLLAILGAVVLFKALTIESEGGQPVGAFAWKPLLIVVGAIVLFGFALPRLGMIITLPLLITVSSMASDEFKWRDALLSSVVLTAGSYAIFIWGLNLVIPIWPTFLGG